MISPATISLLALTLAGATVQAAPTPGASGGVAVPLTKNPALVAREADPVADVEWLKATKKQAARKYRTASAYPSKQASSGGDALTDQQNEKLWTGPITIGGQSFIVDWDTGSSDLWVPSSSCTTSGCSTHNKYTVTTTAVEQSGTFSISYGDKSTASGPIYKDTVAAAGLTASSQIFSPVTSESSSFSNDPSDGICGLAFPVLSALGGTPYFHNLIAQNKVSSPVFSFRLAESSSELYLGGINSDHYTGDITYTPVTEEQWWTVALDGVSLNGSDLDISYTAAVIDTGTTLIYGMPEDVANLWAQVDGSASAEGTYGSDYAGYYTFPCDSVPSVSLTFGGTSFAISTDALNRGQVSSGSSECLGAIVGQKNDFNGWLVGDIFLRGVYSIYDVGNSQVGFAVAA